MSSPGRRTRTTGEKEAADAVETPLEIVRIYGWRFQIEGSFKRALRVVGTSAYRFWRATMTPLRRVSGNPRLYRKPLPYRQAVRRRLAAYHRHTQLGLVA